MSVGIRQSNQYYPFGIMFAESSSPKVQDYKYNGKELDLMHGLNHYDYSARQYDPARLQFTTRDPHSENYYSWSPYAYVANNPTRLIDPTGMDWWDVAAGYTIGFVTNVIPGSSSLRDSYTLTSPSDYNRALEGIDNASIAAGGLMIVGGSASMTGGTTAITAGGVVAVTGVGAPEGAAIAASGVVLVGAGEATVASGIYLMANTAQNKSEGYDRGTRSNKNSSSETNFKKISDNQIKDAGVDAHQLKKDFLGKDAKISRYDLYKDNKSGEILILEKGGKGTPINTGEYIK